MVKYKVRNSSKHLLRGEDGLSLTEVLISGAIVSMVFFAAQNVMKEKNKIEIKQFNKYIINDIKHTLLKALSDENSCEVSLKNLNANSDNITAIKKKIHDGSERNILTAGDKFHNDRIQLTKIQLNNFKKVGPTINNKANGISNIELEFTIKQFMNMGTDTITSSVPVFVSVDSTTTLVNNCKTSEGNVYKSICDALGGNLTATRCQDLNIYKAVTNTGNITAQDLHSTNGSVIAAMSSMVNIYATTINLNMNYTTPNVVAGTTSLISLANINTQNFSATERIQGGTEVRAPQFCTSTNICTTFPTYTCPAGQYMYGMDNTLMPKCWPFPSRNTTYVPL